MNRHLFPLFIICFLLSCVQSGKNDIKKIIQDWQEKEIVKPDIINYKILGKDTVCNELWDKPFRVLTYIDSVGCTGCRLRLPEWKMLIDSCRQQSIDISFIFIVHSSDFLSFTSDVKYQEFSEPIIYDYQNQFYKLNRFPPEPYRTFLLDSQNRVQLIGNPIETPQMWELYKKVITQSK